jgi:hypothetical protein
MGYGLRILGYFFKLGEKNKKSLSCRLNVSRDTLYVLDRRFFKEKGIEKLLIYFDIFLYNFRGLWTKNFRNFSKLGEKNKKSLNCHLNVSKDTLHVLDRRFFGKKRD